MSDANQSNENFTVAAASISSKRAKRLLFCVLLIISLITVVAAVGVFSLKRFLQQPLLKITQQIQAEQKQISLLNNQLIELRQKIQTQEVILQQQGKALTNELLAKNHNSLMAAQYWVELGKKYFILTADIPQTINFLSQSQKELNKITDLQLIPVKQAVAQDISTLKKLPWVDPSTLYLRLIAIQKEIIQLPILLVPVQAAVPTPDLFVTESSWKKGLYNVWHALRRMIVVYHLPAPKAPPFILPDQHPYLYQNLYNTLDQTIWAVLHQDATVYYASLNQAIQWINQYFLLNSPKTKAVSDELIKLRTITVQPAKGVLLGSPKVFQSYIEKK